MRVSNPKTDIFIDYSTNALYKKREKMQNDKQSLYPYPTKACHRRHSVRISLCCKQIIGERLWLWLRLQLWRAWRIPKLSRSLMGGEQRPDRGHQWIISSVAISSVSERRGNKHFHRSAHTFRSPSWLGTSASGAMKVGRREKGVGERLWGQEQGWSVGVKVGLSEAVGVDYGRGVGGKVR